MFLRIDRLQIELPQPTKADPKSAAALQELLGGKFGEMSTLNPRTRWHLRCLHARLPAGGDLRDREQALHGFQELSRGRGRGDRSGKGRPVFKGLDAGKALETTQIS
jgi:Manganese containing catalase